LGCPVLQALAGSGVGTITVIDGDRVDISNLARQWLHQYVDVGLNKAESAQQKLATLNPFIRVEALPEMLNTENADELIAMHDVIVDATDNMDVRYLIDEVCARYNRPWVHAALYRQSAQLCVFWEVCGARFSALYPERSEAPSCAGAGMLGAAASTVANLQALEVIKLITAYGRPQVGAVVSLNTSTLRMQSFKLPGIRSPEILESADRVFSKHNCTVDELRQRRSIGEALRLIDLRPEKMFAEGTIPDAEHLSAEVLLESGFTHATKQPVILFCEEGTISSLLVDALRSRGAVSLYHLDGGFRGWSESL
jgi:adenylyltransferase/sulfurtransferase